MTCSPLSITMLNMKNIRSSPARNSADLLRQLNEVVADTYDSTKSLQEIKRKSAAIGRQLRELNKMSPQELRESGFFSELGRKSAKARMKKIPPEERKRIASEAAKARWAKKGGKK